MDRAFILKDKLVVHVYTIGFDPKGESILLTICDGTKVLFSGLIDCFIDDDDYVIKLLNKLNIDRLDYLCVTHPDSDHCFGLSKILSKVNSNTKIAIPYRIFDFMNQYDENVKESLKKLRNLFLLNSNNKNKPIFNSVCDNSNIIDNLIFIEPNGQQNELQIMTIAPSTNIVERYAVRQDKGNVMVEHNDFSIINLIKINEIKILLTADAENDNIDYAFNNLSKFGQDFFSGKINFVKIPHHTSQGSNSLLKKIKDYGYGIGFSTTTIFRSSSLPNYELFSEYNSCSDSSFCTNPQKSNELKKGIVLYEADITNLTCGVFLVDSAVKYENYNI